MKTHCDCCGNTYPNDDELGFHYWLVEAKSAGHIQDWHHQTCKFPLSEKFGPVWKFSEKTRKMRKSSFQAHTYTPDFSIAVPSDTLYGMIPEIDTEVGDGNFNPTRFQNCFWLYWHHFDVKPSYEKQESKKTVFSINQRWMAQKYGIIVHPVIPADFFHRTWVPEKLAWRLNGKRRVKTGFNDCKLVGEI